MKHNFRQIKKEIKKLKKYVDENRERYGIPENYRHTTMLNLWDDFTYSIQIRIGLNGDLFMFTNLPQQKNGADVTFVKKGMFRQESFNYSFYQKIEI